MKKIKIFMGFDSGNRIPAYVLVDSIIENSSIPVEFVFLHKRTMKNFFNRDKGKYDSTEFSISRFMVPYMSGYKGWSLFIDNDMLVEGDVAELLELMNGDFTIRCTKHKQIVKENIKFLGEEQTEYSMKNWTSVMIFNNEKCKVLTPEYVMKAPGLDLHQFKWLNNLGEEVGGIPLEWNYLCDVESVGQNNNSNPKLIHYTEGGPYFKSTANCEYADNWIMAYKRVNDYMNF